MFFVLVQMISYHIHAFHVRVPSALKQGPFFGVIEKQVKQMMKTMDFVLFYCSYSARVNLITIRHFTTMFSLEYGLKWPHPRNQRYFYRLLSFYQ